MSARKPANAKPDPVIAAWDRLQAAEKAFNAAYDAQDEAEAKARANGSFRPPARMVHVGNYECCSVGEIRRRAKGLSPEVMQPLIDAFRQKERAWNEQRRRAGLVPYDIAERRARREWQAAMQAMATTRAATAAGVILKLKLIALELRDGPTLFGEAILASAIADLSRIGRR